MTQTNLTGRQALTPSLLDRLMDPQEGEGDRPATPEWDWSQHLSSLLRDLQALFNTRQHFDDQALEAYREARRSVLTYGLPEFDISQKQGQDAQRMLKAALLDAIKRFEPRLMNVQLSYVDDKTESRIARFRLEALVRARPAPRRVSFDTQLDLERSTAIVRGEP